MLYIINANKKEFTWHVGEKPPTVHPATIVELQADGHELEHIQKLFTNKLTLHAPPGEEGPKSIEVDYSSIPMPNNRVCRWYGDLARTIYLNL